MTFSTQRRIEFRDTDAAGIVHFSAFFPMMEAAEHEMLRSLGISILDHHDADQLTWPRVAASCQYRSAARFEDVLTITVRVAKIGSTSVEYEFCFDRDGDGQRIAEGRLTVVCCRLPPKGNLEKAVIPDSIRDLLAQHQ